jgi:hypothetical protein
MHASLLGQHRCLDSIVKVLGIDAISVVTYDALIPEAGKCRLSEALEMHSSSSNASRQQPHSCD